MPVTFGAVGDIIAVVLLVKDLVKALDGCRGSASEYRLVIEELRGLQAVLLGLEHLRKTCDATSDFVALGELALQSAAAIRALVEDFYGQIMKFDNSLKASGSGNVAKDAFWKLHWRISHKDAVAQFREKIQAQSQKVTILLVTSHLNVSLISDSKTRVELQSIRDGNEKLLEGQKAELQGINNSIKDVSKQTAESTILSLTSIAYLRDEIDQMFQLIWRTAFRLWRPIVASQTLLPAPRNLWSEPPAILEDAHLRRFRIPLDFIDSWKIFDFILAEKFVDMPGFGRVKAGAYALEDARTGREISRGRPFKAGFRPGRRILMSALFYFVKDEESSSCPSCHHVNPISSGSDVNCSSCGMQYRRITDRTERCAGKHWVETIKKTQPQTDSRILAEFKRVQILEARPPRFQAELPTQSPVSTPRQGQNAMSGWWYCHSANHLNNPELVGDCCSQCNHKLCQLCPTFP